jgi:hypothetical protein
MKRLGWCVLAALATAGTVQAESPELSAEVIAHIEEIRALNPDLREDSFSKMGGSSVASKAFLGCFATDHVDLGQRPELQDTIDFFGTGRGNPFRRQSQAAGVNWNLRYVLAGKPANFRKELRATNARWALVLFGSNDAQNENERVYFERLVYLVEEMIELGVVPVLGSALPRRNRTRSLWIDRFNLITDAVAKHWSLPYIDYNAALRALPRKGLARDGVHPNVLPPGGLKNACVLTEEGLRYGNNVRNLLTLDTLAQLVATAPRPEPEADEHTELETENLRPVLEPQPAGVVPSPEARAPLEEEGDPKDDVGVPRLSLLLEKASLPESAPLPKNCGSPKAGSRQHVTPFSFEVRTRIRVAALDLDGRRPRVLLVKRDEDAEPRCVRRGLQTLEVDVPPGMWDLVIEVPKAAAEEGKLLLLVTPEPR